MNKLENSKNSIAESRIISSLSEQEQKELIELENQILLKFFRVRESEREIKKAQFKIGGAISKILDQKLYRATHETFAEYVSERFNYTREYAYQLASIANYERLNSIPSAIIFDREVRKLAKEFELHKNEIQSQMNFIIEFCLRLLCDIAGYIQKPVTKQLTQNFFDVLKEFVKFDITETNGKQITIEEAYKKGLSKQTIQVKLLQEAKKSILNNETVIKEGVIKKATIKRNEKQLISKINKSEEKII